MSTYRVPMTRPQLVNLVRHTARLAAVSAMAQRAAPLPDAAVRSVAGLDSAWVQRQLRKHEDYIRAAARALDLDPDEALRLDRAGRAWWTEWANSPP
jgi:hypothetical protein